MGKVNIIDTQIHARSSSEESERHFEAWVLPGIPFAAFYRRSGTAKGRFEYHSKPVQGWLQPNHLADELPLGQGSTLSIGSSWPDG